MNAEKAAGETLADPVTAERLAELFHETYERLAPIYHYGTRPESAVPWADVPTLNKALMIATSREILRALRVQAAPAAIDTLRDALGTALNQWRAYASRERGAWGPIHDGDDDEALLFQRCVAALAPSAGSSGTPEVERLRAAVAHAVHRTHDDTDWCDGCIGVRKALAEQPSHPAAPSIGDAE